jgi:hypothetical protein
MHIIHRHGKPVGHHQRFYAKGGGNLQHTIKGFVQNMKKGKYKVIFEKLEPVIDLAKPIVKDMMKGAEGSLAEASSKDQKGGNLGKNFGHNAIINPVMSKGKKTAEAMVAVAKEEAKEVMKQSRIASNELKSANMGMAVENPGTLSNKIGSGRKKKQPKEGGMKMGYGLSSY